MTNLSLIGRRRIRGGPGPVTVLGRRVVVVIADPLQRDIRSEEHGLALHIAPLLLQAFRQPLG